MLFQGLYDFLINNNNISDIVKLYIFFFRYVSLKKRAFVTVTIETNRYFFLVGLLI